MSFVIIVFLGEGEKETRRLFVRSIRLICLSMSKKTLGGNTTEWRIGTEYLGSVNRFFNEHERAIHNRILKRGVSENTAFTNCVFEL